MIKLAPIVVLVTASFLQDVVVHGARFKIRLSEDFSDAYHAHRVRRVTIATTACDDIVEVERESLTLRGNLMMLDERVKFYRSNHATENLMLILPQSVPGLVNATVGDVFDVLRAAECYPLIIGGSVRDQFLGRTPRDVDVEVDCSIEKLVEVCIEAWGAHNCRHSPGSSLAHIGNETLGEGNDIDLASTDLFFFSAPSALEYTVNSLAYETSGDDVIIDLSGTGVVDACNQHIRIPSDDGSEASWDDWRTVGSIKKVYRFWKLREKRLTPYNNATLDYIVRYATLGIEEKPDGFYDFYCSEVFDVDYDVDSHSCPAALETCESGLENEFDFHRAFEEDFMEYWDTLVTMLPSTDCDICQLPADTGPCRASLARYVFSSTKGTCEEFTYGGCDGNQNNFQSLQQCNQKCNPNGCPPYCTNDFCTNPSTRRDLCTFPGLAPQGSDCNAKCRITYCHTCYYGNEHRPNPGDCGTCSYYPEVHQARNKCFKRWATCTRRRNANLYPKARGRKERTQERFKCYEHPCQ